MRVGLGKRVYTALKCNINIEWIIDWATATVDELETTFNAKDRWNLRSEPSYELEAATHAVQQKQLIFSFDAGTALFLAASSTALQSAERCCRVVLRKLQTESGMAPVRLLLVV